MAERKKSLAKYVPPESLKPPLLPGEQIPVFERTELAEYKERLEALNKIANEVFENVGKVNKLVVKNLCEFELGVSEMENKFQGDLKLMSETV